MRKRHPAFYFRDRAHFVEFLTKASDDLVASTIYTSQIGRVFTVIALVEDSLVHALWICENVRVDGRKRPLPSMRQQGQRRGILKDQTFGNLITVLQQNGLSEQSISYLAFIKRLRDQFIHRFFDDNAWPGDMYQSQLLSHSRALAFYELIFNRANQRLWKILGREIFHEFVNLGEDGFLIMNDMSAHLDDES